MIQAMLIYITGVPGTGKSTVHAALRDRGYESYDVDDGFAATYNRNTGEQVDEIKVVRTREWHENNEWKISFERVRELARQTRDRRVFLCGVARNDEIVFGLCERILALDVDELTLRARLASRRNRFGAAPEEVTLGLEYQTAARVRYTRYSIPVIDNTKPIDEVIETILTLI